MLLHAGWAILEASEPPGRINNDQPVHEVLCKVGEVGWPRHSALDDLAVALHRVARHEGRRAGEALEGEDADTPPIGTKAVAFVEDDLGREVLGRTTESPGAVVEDLREAEIDELEVALVVEEEVLRL